MTTSTNDDALEGDRLAIAALPQQFADGWNRHDVAEMDAMSAGDLDFVNVFGMWWRDKETTLRVHRDLFATVFAKSSLTVGEVKRRMLSPQSAALLWRWTMIGHDRAPGEWSSDRHGILLWVVQKIDGAWRLVVSQNTDVREVPDFPGAPR